MNTCYIFGAADGLPEKFEREDSDLVIAADAGIRFLEKLNILPDIAVGDFDSLGFIPDCKEVIQHPVMKNDTDTMLAVKTALSKGYSDITIAASIGGRLDHTFANIQTLAYISANNGTGRLIGENDSVYFLTEGEHSFAKQDNMYFSVFSYSSFSTISLSGTKYTLNDYCLTNTFPLGVSNEILANEGVINIKKGQIIVIFSKM